MINASAPLQDQAYDIIKEKILNDEFIPNELYSETKLAKELTISRTPLRNALRGLEQDGYIIISPSRGFMVRSLDQQGLKESIEIRSAIEGYCIYRIMQDSFKDKRKQLVSELENILAKMEKVTKDASKLDEFIELDHKYHLKIIEAIGNRFQLAEIQRIYYLMRQATRQSLKKEGRIESTHQEHIDLCKSIKAGDAHRAYEAMMEHLSAPLGLFQDLAS